MRDKKYKAWDKNAKEWVEDFIIDRCGNYYQTSKCEFWGDERELEIVEYTGLNDQNNVPIYEGDIFGILGGNVEYPNDYEIHGEVYYDIELVAFCVNKTNGGWEYLHEYVYTLRSEIIGNIYENPSLLPNTKQQ